MTVRMYAEGTGEVLQNLNEETFQTELLRLRSLIIMSPCCKILRTPHQEVIVRYFYPSAELTLLQL